MDKLNSDEKWKPPQEAQDKVPKKWGEGQQNKKKLGWRWRDPENKGNGIRIDKGDLIASRPSQQVDHVRIDKEGKVIGRNGQPIEETLQFPNPSNTEKAHIPLSEWLKWKTWYHL